MRYLIVLMMLFSSISFADPFTFNWDHFGTSYAIQTVSYGLVDTAFKGMGVNDRYGTILFSTVLSIGITTAYTASSGNNQVQMQNKMGSNFLGILASDLTIVVFHF